MSSRCRRNVIDRLEQCGSVKPSTSRGRFAGINRQLGGEFLDVAPDPLRQEEDAAQFEFVVGLPRRFIVPLLTPISRSIAAHAGPRRTRSASSV